MFASTEIQIQSMIPSMIMLRAVSGEALLLKGYSYLGMCKLSYSNYCISELKYSTYQKIHFLTLLYKGERGGAWWGGVETPSPPQEAKLANLTSDTPSALLFQVSHLFFFTLS